MSAIQRYAQAQFDKAAGDYHAAREELLSAGDLYGGDSPFALAEVAQAYQDACRAYDTARAVLDAAKAMAS